MTKAQKQLWLDALRSGKYKQGKKVLRCGDSYCCLGVLCDILFPNEWIPADEDNCYETFRQRKSLPSEVIDEISGVVGTIPSHLFYLLIPGIKSDPRVSWHNSDWISLAQLNDAEFSFLEIANIIEKHVVPSDE